ncbi:hypothetical protein ES703_42564 [subsurface metagenome]
MKRKVLSILFALVLVLSFSLVMAVPAVASPDPRTLEVSPRTLPTILLDGVIGSEEWGSPDFSGTQTVDVSSFEVNIYVENDDENLYIAAEYVSGDFSVAQSLGLATALNIYIDANPPTLLDGVVDNGDLGIIASDDVIHIPYDPGANDWDWQEEGSASAAGIEIVADGDYMIGNGIVEVKIPLGFEHTDQTLDPDQGTKTYLDIVPGDTIGLLFQAFGNNYIPLWPTVPEDTNAGWPETYTPLTLAPFSSIQAAINAAELGDTVDVAKGTYNENVLIEERLTLLGAQHGEDPTVDGGRVGDESTINAAGITISADSVTVDGFTITGAPKSAISTSSDENIIVNNILSNNGYRGVEIGGTSDDNTIANNVMSHNGREGIYLFEDEGGNTIENNVISHSGRPGIYVSWSDDNTIENNVISYSGEVDSGEWVAGISLNGALRNTLTGNTLSNQCRGICMRDSVENTLTHNTISNNDYGIYLRTGKVTGNTGNEVHHNNIVGNTEYGVYNAETETFDATNNWWGDVAGPDSVGAPPHNPYTNFTEGDAVSDYVDYLPWLIQIELVEGWNIWSVPIILDVACLPQLDAALTDEELVDLAYYFDSTTQDWYNIPEDASLMDAWYIKMFEPVTVNIWASSGKAFPWQKEMKVGWNFVGLAELYPMPAPEALTSALYGTGEANLWGYSQVMSPSLNGASWTYLRETTPATMPIMVPTKGYWVFMVNDGVLGGFSSTPIVEVDEPLPGPEEP